jgi:hypothetical protein
LFDNLLHDDTDDPPDDADELNDIIEFGRRADFTSGSVPANELRNFGATRGITKNQFIAQIK